MVIDTSAIVAILRDEPAAGMIGPKFFSGGAIVTAPNVLEASMVLRRYFRADADALLAKLLVEAGVTIIPFTPEHAAAATLAFDRYGRGRHPAALNFGDCMAYAVAKVSGQPLLFTGDDFSKTDIPAA